MNSSHNLPVNEIIRTVHYRPAVSILLPVEPRMNQKALELHSLHLIAHSVELQLKENYPKETVSLIMHKLNGLTSNLKPETNRKGIAIYVSPLFEKLFYLDIIPEQKIVIDESFEIRDLVFGNKKARHYFLLLLSAHTYKIFSGAGKFLELIESGSSAGIEFSSDPPERIANFSDLSEHRENLLHRFLRQADQELSQLLHQKTMPLFVAGPERILGHFNKITRYGNNIISQIHGNYEEASKDELRKLLVPHLADWEQLRQRNLLKRLEEAEGKKKLAVGIKEAWKQAMRKNGRLLVVEKNYSFPAIKSIDPEVLEGVVEPYNKFSAIKDAVDDIIEKVLTSGGDIEFVDAPLLQHHQHIVLEQFY